MIAAGAALVTVVLCATVWAGRGLWRRLTGARRGADGLEAGREPRDAPEPSQPPANDSSYQEAA